MATAEAVRLNPAVHPGAAPGPEGHVDARSTAGTACKGGYRRDVERDGVAASQPSGQPGVVGRQAGDPVDVSVARPRPSGRSSQVCPPVGASETDGLDVDTDTGRDSACSTGSAPPSTSVIRVERLTRTVRPWSRRVSSSRAGEPTVVVSADETRIVSDAPGCCEPYPTATTSAVARTVPATSARVTPPGIMPDVVAECRRQASDQRSARSSAARHSARLAATLSRSAAGS